MQISGASSVLMTGIDTSSTWLGNVADISVWRNEQKIRLSCHRHMRMTSSLIWNTGTVVGECETFLHPVRIVEYIWWRFEECCTQCCLQFISRNTNTSIELLKGSGGSHKNNFVIFAETVNIFIGTLLTIYSTVVYAVVKYSHLEQQHCDCIYFLLL